MTDDAQDPGGELVAELLRTGKVEVRTVSAREVAEKAWSTPFTREYETMEREDDDGEGEDQ